MNQAHLDELSFQMKQALGCGATLEGTDLLLLGSLERPAAQWLRGAGARQVVMGTVGRTQSAAKPERAPSGCATTANRPRVERCSAAAPAGTDGSLIRQGLRVAIVLKANQRTGSLTEGVVQAILTNSARHPHGIKVCLESGLVGRVKRILD